MLEANLRLTILNALIFDGVSAELTEGSIRVVDGKIAEIGGSWSSDEHTIDAHGAVVIPGLIDAHFHAYAHVMHMARSHASPLSYVALVAARRLEKALRRGFTTVRDVAGGDAGIAKAIDEGVILAPRYLFTGPAMSQTGGHGDARSPDLDFSTAGHHMTEVVDGVDALRVASRERFRIGAHALKIMTSGGISSPSDPIRLVQYSAEEVRVVVEEATRRGSYVIAHAYSPAAIEHSVLNGVRSIEHGNLLDGSAAQIMADSGACLVPTLVAYDAVERRKVEIGLSAISAQKNHEVLDAGRRAIEIARAAGVTIGFGTDLIGSLEDEQLQGLRLQAEVEGVLEVLRSATSVNAGILGRDDLGRVAVGKAADLLILDGNPFTDPAVLWTESERRTVILGGRVL